MDELWVISWLWDAQTIYTEEDYFLLRWEDEGDDTYAVLKEKV